MNQVNVKPFERIFNSSLTLRRAQLYGEINMSDVSYIEALLQHFADQKRESKKPVTISVFTGGGSLDASLALYDLIRDYRKKFPVWCLAVGPCMSGGVIVMQAAHLRLAYPHARFMVHDIAFLGSNQSFAEQQIQAEESKRLQKLVRDIIYERSRIDLDKLRKAKGPVDHYYDADLAKHLGLIDKIVYPEQSISSVAMAA